MAIDPEKSILIEELKEIGHDYRYREQLMVQEFGFSMIVTGVVAGIVLKDTTSAISVVIQAYGLLFLMLLTLHLRNLNQDRRAAGARKGAILKDLGFYQVHQGIGGFRTGATFFDDISAPRNMVRYTGLVTLGWAVWTGINAIPHLK